jgi:hypothetical protein
MNFFSRLFSYFEKYPAISVILIGLPALASVYYILTFGVNVISWDQWELVPDIDKLLQGNLTIEDLFRQHNEHRLFFPRIAMLTIAYLTHFNTVAEMLFGWVILIITFIILFALFRKSFGISNKYLLLFVPVAWLFFTTKQWENLLWGWQMQIFLSSMGFLLSVYCLEKVEKVNLFFILAIVGGIISTFSFFNGLLVWIAGALYILIKKKPKIILYSWIGSAFFVFTFFFVNWIRIERHPSPIFILNDPVGGILFFIANVGAGLSGGESTVFLATKFFALFFGTVTLSAIIFGLYFNYRYHLFERNATWWTLISFSLMTSLILSLGRGGFGFWMSLQSRYITFTILGIIGIYYVLAQLFLHETKFTLGKCAFAFFTILLVIGIILGNIQGINIGYQWKSARTNQANYLLHYQNETDPHLVELYPSADRIRKDAGILEKIKYNVFSK